MKTNAVEMDGLDLPEGKANFMHEAKKGLGIFLILMRETLGQTLQIAGYGYGSLEKVPVAGVPFDALGDTLRFTSQNLGKGRKKALERWQQRQATRAIEKVRKSQDMQELQKVIQDMPFVEKAGLETMRQAQQDWYEEQP